MYFGKRIQQVRKQKKLSQAEFANKLGVTQAHISKLESNQIQASETFTLLVCAEFNISKMWLINGEGEMNCDFYDVGSKDLHKENINNIIDNLNKMVSEDICKDTDYSSISIILSTFISIIKNSTDNNGLNTLILEKVCYIFCCIDELISNSNKISINGYENNKTKIKIDLLNLLLKQENEIKTVLNEVTNIFIDKLDM